MKNFLSFLLAVAMGCGSDSSADGAVENGGGNTDGVTTSGGPGVQTGSLVAIHALAPEGFVGDFSYGNIEFDSNPSGASA